MKAYLFNTESGLYEGETFEDAAMLAYEDGITLLPPPDFGHGQVPVFDRFRKQWTVVPITIARQLLHIDTEPKTEKQS